MFDFVILSIMLVVNRALIWLMLSEHVVEGEEERVEVSTGFWKQGREELELPQFAIKQKTEIVKGSRLCDLLAK